MKDEVKILYVVLIGLIIYCIDNAINAFLQFVYVIKIHKELNDPTLYGYRRKALKKFGLSLVCYMAYTCLLVWLCIKLRA